MKTKEELNALKEEVKTLNAKLAELSDEELTLVAGGDVTSANIVGYNGSPAVASVKGKKLIVMGSSIGWDISAGQFDVMIPGGDC